MTVWHVKVNSGRKPDLYASPEQYSLWGDTPCGCDLAPCGHAVAKPTCFVHGDDPKVFRRIHSAHLETNCPRRT